MSRAYRIRVREKACRTLSANDRVTTHLELLEVLPCEEMAALLADELTRRGFEPQGEVVVRRDGGVLVSVDPRDGSVTVATEATKRVALEAEREGNGYDDIGPNGTKARETLKEQARQEIDREAKKREAALQTEVTDRLERHLDDLRQELDRIANRVTAEALKIKAARMGQIKEMTEDEETGSLTLVVEV